MNEPTLQDHGDRTAILSRIREALREEAPRHYENVGAPPAGSPVTAAFREWLPPVGASRAAEIEVFAELSKMLKTEFKQCATLADAAAHVSALAQEGGWKRLATHSNELNDALIAQLGSGFEVVRTDDGYDKNALESCDAGISGCECLVAQTGSVCVTNHSSGGRALSVFPPHHIVLVRESQLVRDLTAAYELLAQKYAPNYPSFMSFITGPSRTGDIERILVLGAHGPKKLTVLLLP